MPGVKKSEPKNERWTPRSWSDADRRRADVRRIEGLREEVTSTPPDDLPRRLLTDRAAYLSARLEGLEVDSLTRPVDPAEYRRLLESLLAVLSHLGPGPPFPDGAG